MGLLRAVAGALGGALASQWKEYFYADALPDDVLACMAQKRTKGRFGGSRTEDDNVISSGSIIAVNEGQCMMIVDQGKIVEYCAEPGEYLFDADAEPSLFAGDAMEAILQATYERFAFGGQAGTDQRVYFFNTKEIIGNRYGTPNPIPFRVVDTNIGLDVDISIRCFGEYSYRIVNPMLFYVNVCGNVEGDYTREQIDSQLKTELLTALQPAFAKISAKGIRYSALPGHTAELADALNEALSDKWSLLRGLEIVSFGLSSVKASDEDEAMIKELQRSATFRNPSMAAAHLVDAQADAMRGAAQNSGGAFMGFAGMSMASQAGGFDARGLFHMDAQRPDGLPEQGRTDARWTCACGVSNDGKFCSECGKENTPKVEWACACGTKNIGKFCSECGAKMPNKRADYRCDKCGWRPEDPSRLPKFCPACGDVFDERDGA